MFGALLSISVPITGVNMGLTCAVSASALAIKAVLLCETYSRGLYPRSCVGIWGDKKVLTKIAVNNDVTMADVRAGTRVK